MQGYVFTGNAVFVGRKALISGTYAGDYAMVKKALEVKEMAWKSRETGEWLTKITVAEQTFANGPILCDGSLADAIITMKELLDSIPEDFREAAQIDIDADDSRPEFRVFYYRPATDEEIATSISEEAVWRSSVRRRELAQLAELKAKYGEQS